MKKADTQKTSTHQVAKRIKQFRNERDLRQIDMAESIGLSARHFQKIESGNTAVNIGMLEKISSTLKVPSCYLLKDGACAGLHEMGLGCQVEILDFLKIPVVIADLKGQIVYLNPHSRNILGELNTSPKFIWDFLNDPSEKNGFRTALENALASQIEPQRFTSRSSGVQYDWNYLKKGADLVGIISSVFI